MPGYLYVHKMYPTLLHRKRYWGLSECNTPENSFENSFILFPMAHQLQEVILLWWTAFNLMIIMPGLDLNHKSLGAIQHSTLRSYFKNLGNCPIMGTSFSLFLGTLITTHDQLRHFLEYQIRVFKLRSMESNRSDVIFVLLTA